MVTKAKTPAAAKTEKAARKPRTPKPVDDLASATVALNAAKRKADRTAKARAEAVAADGLAQTELAEAKATVKKFYAELMGENLGEGSDVQAPELTEQESADHESAFGEAPTETRDEV